METIDQPRFHDNQEVYIYGLEEMAGTIISSQYKNNTWYYIVQMQEESQHPIYSIYGESSIQTDT